MSEQEIRAQIEAELGDVISRAFAARGGMAIKWLCLAEAFGTEGKGEVALWNFTSGKLSAWDTKGMLGHAMDFEQAETIAGFLTEDEGDGG